MMHYQDSIYLEKQLPHLWLIMAELHQIIFGLLGVASHIDLDTRCGLCIGRREEGLGS